jgi:hypothetical protein
MSKKLLALAVLFAAQGCVHWKLKDYVPRLRGARATVTVPAWPTCDLGHKGDMSLVGAVTTGLGEREVENKLRGALDNDLALHFRDAFLQAVRATLPFPIGSKEEQANPDTEVQLVITEYGWRGGYGGGVASWHYDVHTVVTYKPENLVLWEHTRAFTTGTPFYTGSRVVSQIVSVDMITRRSIDEIRAEMTSLGQEAARGAAWELVHAATHDQTHCICGGGD